MTEYTYVGQSAPAASGGRKLAYTPTEWLHLAALYGFIAILHIGGWWLYLHYATECPALAGWLPAC